MVEPLQNISRCLMETKDHSVHQEIQLQDPGVELLCPGPESPDGQLETLRSPVGLTVAPLVASGFQRHFSSSPTAGGGPRTAGGTGGGVGLRQSDQVTPPPPHCRSAPWPSQGPPHQQ